VIGSSPSPTPSPRLLLIDTATARSVVAVGTATGLLARSERLAGHRHGSHVLEQVEECLAAAGWSLAGPEAIAVGTGPGSFTGLRVGLATAKTLAYVRGLPILAFGSDEALRRAAEATLPPGTRVVLVLPAGAHDHYVSRRDAGARLVAAGDLPAALEGSDAVAAVDLRGDPLGAGASELGRRALEGLADAALGLALEGHAAGATVDPAALVPAYVALPRGMGLGEGAWAPDLR
jgi:tRNA threonylcarbamoyl adenosine modification protein YeaZ